nr:EEIG1/EHBP1 N-terminal domain-containing protein [Tanacetum cinerariifolium]
MVEMCYCHIDRMAVMGMCFDHMDVMSIHKCCHIVGVGCGMMVVHILEFVVATSYVNAFGGTVTGCLEDVDNFLKKGKLEQIVGIVKSCSLGMLGNLNVTLKDLSGTIRGTIHYKVIGESGYGKDITVGAAMILKNVSVFTPKPSKHYLNITMRNVVEVFRKDTVPGSGSG